MLPPRVMTVADILAAGGLSLDLGNLTPEQYNQISEQIRTAVKYYRYSGLSFNASLDEAGVKALAVKDTASTRSTVIEMQRQGEPAYAFYAYPTALGLPSSYAVYDNASNVMAHAVPELSLLNITDDDGVAMQYALVRTPTKIAGLVRVVIG